jgi:hypothetical protein
VFVFPVGGALFGVASWLMDDGLFGALLLLIVGVILAVAVPLYFKTDHYWNAVLVFYGSILGIGGLCLVALEIAKKDSDWLIALLGLFFLGMFAVVQYFELQPKLAEVPPAAFNTLRVCVLLFLGAAGLFFAYPFAFKIRDRGNKAANQAFTFQNFVSLVGAVVVIVQLFTSAFTLYTTVVPK